MKTSFLLSLLLFSISTYNLFGQSKPDPAIFPPETFVWCGIDFSHARLIGSQGFTNPEDIQARYFDQWNVLMLNEQDKYNFRTAYSKPNQISDFSVVNRRNQIPDASSLVINQDYAFEDVTVENAISDYDLADHKEGLGLVYVIESFNKTTNMAHIHVVFFDIASKNILWNAKYTTSPGGFGLRNYWAHAILEAIEMSGSDYKKAMQAYHKAKG